ncbi:uncharacterized protein CLAFUR5_09165 [Fulvia fulva]|uniref:Uncharacterized protein n=1 Tax=Passalora fulva TaxID=5499 RepID=A0A9Q8PFX7_PASFU|nr:uncharacterized protein CLAFUR5_09165 [Fulvia fulva]UJO21884.1 hypothetical protein CLAFUR5_09165 [Fulvia fulva]
MEICGHQIFPELVEKPKPRKSSSNCLGGMIKDLERKQREETAARIAAVREAQQKEADFHLSDAEDYFPDDIRDVRVSGHTSCKLLELPPDILNLIVDHSVPQKQSRSGDGQTYTAALKHLRLIHPCFANLRLLLNRLFGSLTLRADPDQLRELDKGIKRVTPFVKKVVFSTVKVKRSTLAKRKRRDHSSEIRRVLGRRTEKIVEDGSLPAAWSSLMKQCPNLSEFRIAQGLVDSENIDLGPSARDLFRIVVKSIIAASKQPHNLSIDYVTDEDRIWITLAAWQELDFTKLTELDLSITMEHGHKNCAPVLAFKEEARALLAHVLQESSGSLQKLTASGHVLEALLEMDVLIPDLREVCLNGRYRGIDLVRLERLINDLGGLRTLRLKQLSSDRENGIEHWRPIFAAIRHHTNDLHVEFNSVHIYGHSTFQWRLNYNHQPLQPAIKVNKGETPGEAMNKMAKNYMSKHGDWYVLESWNAVLHENSTNSDLQLFGQGWQSDEDQ